MFCNHFRYKTALLHPCAYMTARIPVLFPHGRKIFYTCSARYMLSFDWMSFAVSSGVLSPASSSTVSIKDIVFFMAVFLSFYVITIYNVLPRHFVSPFPKFFTSA